jgi:hypothetical protein
MALCLRGYIELPPNQAKGGFDHADIYPPTDRLYVAHTSNDAIDVIDISRIDTFGSVSGLTGVAGLRSYLKHADFIFTSNRGRTVSVFAPGAKNDAFKSP